jgi:DNA-binding NarL/FixJ family response regulator
VSGGSITVFLVDDHEIVREGIKRMLVAAPGITVVGEASSGEEALRSVPLVGPDVVLLDLSLPGIQGLAVLEGLEDLASPPRVVVLSIHDEAKLVLGAARLGAHGYVLKQASRNELLEAIGAAAAGGFYFSPEIVDVLRAPTSAAPASQATLSARELEVLRLVAAGADNREIAERLYVSSETVKSHLANVYRKLGVAGRAHAVAAALRQGQLD